MGMGMEMEMEMAEIRADFNTTYPRDKDDTSLYSKGRVYCDVSAKNKGIYMCV